MHSKQEDKVILGIDPGTTVMGYGVVRIQGQRMEALEYGVLRLEKLKNHADKLHRIFHRTSALIEAHNPDYLAVEAPFFGKNVQSMLKLGRAQGTAIAAALARDIPIEEYTPRKVKQSITGKGGASKEQVAAMVQRLLNLKELPKYMDATDALGVALCHHFQKGVGEHNKAAKGTWDQFISANPGRVKK